MQTMLVPLDGSALAEQALPFARWLAEPLRARVVLLHVFTDPEHEFVAAGARLAGDGRAAQWLSGQQARWQARRRAIEQYLAGLAAPLRAAGLRVDLLVELGPPAEMICAAAERERADLVVLTSHGRGRLRRWAAGSITEQLLRALRLPFLLVRAGMQPPAAALARLVALVDGSVAARYVLAHALALAHSAQAELVVLQTVADSIEQYLGGGSSLVNQRAALQHHVRQAYASHFGEQQARVAAIVAAIGLGEPYAALLEEAEQRRAELLVLANSRLSPGRRPGLATLDRVLRAADAPLLLVPPQSAPG